MNLSMWILADRLKIYEPELHINSGRLILKGARLFPENGRTENDYVYVGMGRRFVDTIGEKVICANGADYFLLNGTDAESAFNEILDIFEDFHEWMDLAGTLAQSGCAVQSIMDCSDDWIENFTIAGDLTFTVVASCHSLYIKENSLYSEYYKTFVDLKQISLEDALQASSDKRSHFRTKKSYIQDNPYFRHRALIRNLFQGDRQIGWLVSIEFIREITPGQEQLLNILGDLLEQHQSLSGSFREIQSLQDLFLSVLEGEKDFGPAIETKLETIQWSPDDQKILLLIGEIQAENIQLMSRILAHSIPNAIVLPENGNLICVIDLKWMPEDSLYVELHSMLESFHTSGGLSYPFTDIRRLRTAYEQAKIALINGNPTSGSIVSCKENAVPYFMEILKQEASAAMLHPALQILEEYDSLNRTDLKDTLRAYLESERSLLLTAQRMRLHKNTVTYRIRRICELTSLDLDNEKTRFHLLLSYHLESAIKG